MRHGPPVECWSATRKVSNISGSKPATRAAVLGIVMGAHGNDVLSRGRRSNCTWRIAVATIPSGHNDEHGVMFVHVIIKIPGLSCVRWQFGTPGGAMNMGAISATGEWATGREELGVKREVERAVVIANVGEGNLGTGGDAISHAGTINAISSNGSNDVGAMSILHVRTVDEIFVLHNFAGIRIHEVTRTSILSKVTIIPIHTCITNRHHLSGPIQPHIKERPSILHFTLHQPLTNCIRRLDPFLQFQGTYIRMSRNGE
mmetsp:Transcript_9076/g.19627  ORF Transcript_9076/g.19627 Transcript_9076/m.19627 type:complete len:259 (-) Transcript_9076:1236-2012(-)